jgi:hypothetical protein
MRLRRAAIIANAFFGDCVEFLDPAIDHARERAKERLHSFRLGKGHLPWTRQPQQEAFRL